MSHIDTLLDTYGLTYISFWTGHDRRAIKKHLSGRINPAITDAFTVMHAAHQAGAIPIQHLDTIRVDTNAEHMTRTEGQILRALYALTNDHGQARAAHLCGISRWHVTRILDGECEHVTLPTAHRILTAAHTMEVAA